MWWLNQEPNTGFAKTGAALNARADKAADDFAAVRGGGQQTDRQDAELPRIGATIQNQSSGDPE